MTPLAPAIKTNLKNFEKFFDWTKEYLKKHDKKLTLSNTKKVRLYDSMYCRGWCDGDQISVAVKNKDFHSVYAHEFSHMQQAIEKIDLWENCDDKFWKELEKKNGKMDLNCWNSILDTIKIERDCERRTLLTSKKWGLFDNATYAKQANLYLYFYQYVFLKGKWVPTSKIQHPKIVQAMPDKLLPISTFESIDMEIMALFDKYLSKYV